MLLLSTSVAQAVADDAAGAFVRKDKSISGDWHIETNGEARYLVLADNFRAARGPDLKVFLSPRSIEDVTGRTATDGALRLGELDSTRGAQRYRIPDDAGLETFESVLVHCERYAVLWGGGEL